MKTKITELLGIEYPIIQGAMYNLSLPGLVAAVSNAGGLGFLGAAFMNGKEIEAAIKKTKSLTSKPFGVNIVPRNPSLQDALDIIIAEKVPVVGYGIGDPAPILKRIKPLGILAMPSCGAVAHAVKAEKDGADIVIVQGHEAGGHNSNVATSVLVPAVVDKVKIPVVAAGGFADARGLVAAFALGAEGICMGTRFIVTKECITPQAIKEYYVSATEEDTLVSSIMTGIPARILKSLAVEKALALGKTPSREVVAESARRGMEAFFKGDINEAAMGGGQVVGLIHDIPTCQELIQRIVSGAAKISRDIQVKVGK